MGELLIPIIGHRIVLLEELEKLRRKENSSDVDENATPVDGEVSGVNEESRPEDIETAVEPGPSSSTSIKWHDLHDYK